MEIDSSKKISLFSGILISVTSMVGSGWLFSAQLTAQHAGNWAFAAWIMAAIVVFMVGICLAKVVAQYPVRGATTRSSAISHNSVFAMPFAFANWFGIVVVISTEAVATTQYLAGVSYFNWLMTNGKLTATGMIFSLFILCVYLLVNFYGVKLFAKINNGITIFKMIVPATIVVIFIVYAFTHADQHHSMFSPDIPNNSQYGFTSALTAIVAGGLIYTFNGFQSVVAYSSEIKNPSKNVPLAIIISLLIALVLYLGLQYGFMQAVPHNYLLEKGGWAGIDFESPLLQVGMLIGLFYISFLLIVDSVISPSATGYTYLGACSRMLYGMSAEGQVPKYFSKINEKVNISRRSLIANFILSAIFLLFSDNWATLMLVVSGFNILGYMAAPISMGALSPKTRWFGLITFVTLGLLLNTIQVETNEHMSVILLVLMTIYGSIEFRRVGLKNLLILVLPFLLYICLIAPIQNYYFAAIASVIFYLFATDKKFIEFCKKTAKDKSLTHQ